MVPGCSHRPVDAWGRVWQRWLLSVAVSFGLLETAALLRCGSAATLSAHLRRLAGLHQSCRHAPLGRVVIVAALAWLAVHLGWGLFGLDLDGREDRPH